MASKQDGPWVHAASYFSVLGIQGNQEGEKVGEKCSKYKHHALMHTSRQNFNRYSKSLTEVSFSLGYNDMKVNKTAFIFYGEAEHFYPYSPLVMMWYHGRIE